MPHGLTRPRPEPERSRMPRSDRSRSGLRAGRKRIRLREHREQESEEYLLREQHGLSPPTSPVNSSSEEEEEKSDRGRPPRGGIPHPRHRGPQRLQRSRRPRWVWRRPTSSGQ
jgi:hypothetical protein